MKYIFKILLHALLATFTQQFEVVKIGAIFFGSERNLQRAFDSAVLNINQRELDVRLETIKRYVNVDDSIALQQLTCELIENGVAAIFGPSSKASSDIVEVICNITGIPHLQYDWHGQPTNAERINYQLTVNVAPSETVLATAYWDILRSSFFDWKSFTIAYETGASLARMQQVFAWKNVHKTGIKMKSFQRGDDYRLLWKMISNNREKLVVLDCPSDILLDVLNASSFYNMTGPFNSFLLIDLDAHTSGLEALYSSQFSAFVAAVRIRSYIPPALHDELDVFEDQEVDEMVSARAQLIYDSVMVYFTALRNIVRASHFYNPQLSCSRGFWTPGPEIVQNMKMVTSKNSTFPFKTQKMQLNAHGERDDFNLEIYNPFTDRITYVWNKFQQVVELKELVENATKKTMARLQDKKEDFSQRRVRFTVATRIGEPYFMWRPEPEGEHYEGNERFEGYAVDLIYKLAEECRFDFIFEPVRDNGYGSYDAVTDEWNGIIRELIDNNAQIGICDLTITQARRLVVDFTVPFMQLGISILHYRSPMPPTNLFAFLKPYALEVWVNLLLALVVTALVLLIMARISNPDWENPNENEDHEIVVECKWYLINTLWLMIGSILTAGCDILPRGGPMRVITAFWWIFALLMSQTYIAKLASFITSAKMEGTIADFHDLVDQNKIQFGTVKGGSTSLFFSESNESDYRVAWNKMTAMRPEAFTASNKEGVDRVKRSRGRYAFLMETTNLQYYVQRNCELTQIGEPFGEKLYGIAVPLNAPFRSNLSVGILKLSEKGVLYQLKSKWFNSNESMACSADGGAAGGIQFDMESVGGLFIVLIVGVILAFLIAIGEVLWHVEDIAVKQKLPFMFVLRAELRFFVSFWRHRKPRCTYKQNGGSIELQSSDNAVAAKVKVRKKKKTKKV